MKKHDIETLNQIIDRAGKTFRPICLQNIRIGFQKAIQKQGWNINSITIDKLMDEEVDDDFLHIMKRIDINKEDIQQEAQLILDMLKKGETETEDEFIQKFRKKIGRNDTCPCGSGKKYKRCCGV